MGAAAGRASTPSPASWDNEIIYSVVVDRFANGNTSNDLLNIPPAQATWVRDKSGPPRQLPQWRHGGDIAGITARMGYLQLMGVTTLWVTPVLGNNGDYHGYCLTDPTKIDEGFGTWDEMAAMVAAAHAAGVKVVLDLVVNHICDRATSYAAPGPPSGGEHEACASDMDSAYWGGTPPDSSHRRQLAFSPSFFRPFQDQSFLSRCGPNSGGDTSGEGAAAVWGDFTTGMFDLNTASTQLQKLFVELHLPLITALDVDGFRLDAVKHTTEDFVAALATGFRAAAAAAGKTNFLVVGEVAASADWIGRRVGAQFCDPTDPVARHGNVPATLPPALAALKATYLAHPTFPLPGLNAPYEFALSGTLRDVLLGNRASCALADYLGSDARRVVTGQQADGNVFWTLLEIHDWPRFLSGDPTDPQKAMAGATALLATQGMPIIYQGLEHGHNGVCPTAVNLTGEALADVEAACASGDDSVKRQNLFAGGPWSLGAAEPNPAFPPYIGLWAAAATPAWQQDPALPTGGMVWRAFRSAAWVRRTCRPLQIGAMYVRTCGGNRGDLFAFSRLVPRAGSDVGEEIVVVVNPGLYPSQPPRIQVDAAVNGKAGAVYRNLFFKDQTAVVVLDAGGAWLVPSVATSTDEYQVWVHEDNVGSPDPVTGVYGCRV